MIITPSSKTRATAIPELLSEPVLAFYGCWFQLLGSNPQILVLFLQSLQ